MIGSLKHMAHERLPVISVLLIGITLSVGGYFGAEQYYRTLARQEFDQQASHYRIVVEKAFTRQTEAVAAASEQFAAARIPDRWDFDKFAEPHIALYQGLDSLMWVPRVAGGQRADYETKAAKGDGLTGFRFTEHVEGKAPRKAADRPTYFPAYYVVPFKGNEHMLGFDLGSRRDFAAAFARAGDSGAMAVVIGEAMLAGTQSLAIAYLVKPVYGPDGVPEDQESRRETLTGFLVGRVILGAVVATALREQTAPAWLDVYIYDGQPELDAGLLYYQPSVLRMQLAAALPAADLLEGPNDRSALPIAQGDWTLLIAAVAGKYSPDAGLIPYTIVFVLLAMTLYFAHYLWTARNRRREIERLVAERTVELSEAVESLHSEIEERRLVEAELRAAKDQAEVASKAKSEFLAMISHELRTPLNAIIGFSEMILSEVYGPLKNKKYAEYIKDIGKSGTHLLSLINNILDLSKVEANELSLEEDEIGLEDVISDALEIVGEQAAVAGLTVETEIVSDLPGLHADPRTLRQILLNLLSNAIKFTPSGGRILISASIDEEGRQTLTVEDTGIGIPEEDIENVFLPFTQVDSSLAREYEGTGLGLPLTRSLVQLHGGKVHLASQAGKGTVATVTFPAVRSVTPTPKRSARVA